MKKKRHAFEVFNLSFLDVVSCGFGAIVLLLVIVKVSEPLVAEKTTTSTREAIARLSRERETLENQATTLASQAMLAAREREELTRELETLHAQQLQQRARQQETLSVTASQEIIITQLQQAIQELNEEMRRLQAARPLQTLEAPIGGIPVDSEYIIFVIDTSGSMQQSAWPLVQKKMREILEIYPHVQGLQVMNDMGDYMFSQYAGRWIRDTPARRQAILERLRTWTPFSNSSPVEGVTAAIRRFHADSNKISIYVFGDDFSRGSIQEVVDTINRINQSDNKGSRRVRIHAVGFPVLFGQPGAELNISRFAALMRRLAEDNNGSFVGLTKLR